MFDVHIKPCSYCSEVELHVVSCWQPPRPPKLPLVAGKRRTKRDPIISERSGDSPLPRVFSHQLVSRAERGGGRGDDESPGCQSLYLAMSSNSADEMA